MGALDTPESTEPTKPVLTGKTPEAHVVSVTCVFGKEPVGPGPACEVGAVPGEAHGEAGAQVGGDA